MSTVHGITKENCVDQVQLHTIDVYPHLFFLLWEQTIQTNMVRAYGRIQKMANKGQKRDAEGLGDLLSTLYIQQQSGLLNVECLQNGRQEEGELYILAGQPIYARIGKQGGQEALKRLLLWRPLRFSFAVDAPRPPANLPASVGVSPVPAHVQPTVAARVPGSPPMNGAHPPREQMVPHKIGMPRQALSLSLTHRQRMMYFLINGQRTIADLSRTSGKTVSEVEEVLQELQYHGLIQIFPFSS
jgi:hypothetical protein